MRYGRYRADFKTQALLTIAMAVALGPNGLLIKEPQRRYASHLDQAFWVTLYGRAIVSRPYM